MDFTADEWRWKTSNENEWLKIEDDGEIMQCQNIKIPVSIAGKKKIKHLITQDDWNNWATKPTK